MSNITASQSDRKRTNSIIPSEFMNDTSSGGMERAALATVFGVKEYTESKIFWNAGQEQDEETTGFKPVQRSASKRNSKSYNSVSANDKQSPQHYVLPSIPAVSEFGDLWQDAPLPQVERHFSAKIHDPFQVPAPQDLSDYPVSLFDDIKGDASCIIIWGTDPKQPQSQDASSKKKTRWSAQHLIPDGLKLPIRLKSHTKSQSLSSVSDMAVEPTQVIEAATIEKLVEKLTVSLDYSFMTDFFLIFRVFMTPIQLCKFLILRFRWAVENNDEERRIVRIRTFVVLRHWLQNYFLHDFVPSRQLRVTLTSFLNVMPFHPIIKQSQQDQNIIKILKRVVQRLKKIYYQSSQSARVQVIEPPPPTSEQEKVREMVNYKLSQSALRQKTLTLVDRINVDARHGNNTALRDKTSAPIVVIGNFPKATSQSFIEVARQRNRGLSVSSSRKSASTLPTNINQHRNSFPSDSGMREWSSISANNLDTEKRLEEEEDAHYPNEPDDDFCDTSVVSHNSFESFVSPGTSEASEDDQSHVSFITSDAEDKNSMTKEVVGDELTHKLEEVRRQQEEEEEMSRRKFFSIQDKNEPSSIEPDTLGNGVRTRSFYSAQLAIPSNISTPDNEYAQCPPADSNSLTELASPMMRKQVFSPPISSDFKHQRMSKTYDHTQNDRKTKPLPRLASADLLTPSRARDLKMQSPNSTLDRNQKVEMWRQGICQSASEKELKMSANTEEANTPKSRVKEMDLSPSISRPDMIQRPMSGLDHSVIIYYPTDVLAQQFCTIEKDVLLDISWEELVDCRWTKMASNHFYQPDMLGKDQLALLLPEQLQQGIFSRTKRKMQQDKKSQSVERGIERAINRFNAVCQWVSFEIVKTRNREMRARVIEKFIRLAKKCTLYCNFATLLQILLGLQSASVSRLEKTWALVHKREMKTLQELSNFTSPTKNWKNLRDEMNDVAEKYGMAPTEIQVEVGSHSNAHKNRSKKSVVIKLPFGGCIPFLGIYLSDLVFNAELPPYLANKSGKGAPVVMSQSLVHFRKHRVTAAVIKRVLVFQSLAQRYPFGNVMDEELVNMCHDVPAPDLDQILRLSCEIEPK
ncbi:ras GEF [Backusella circina FSU 941]|nr:ras GEF [Backusella circina FSU 941]